MTPLLLLLLAVCAGLLYLRQSKYAAHFSYDRGLDAHPAPPVQSSRSTTVTVGPDGFSWPEGQAPAHTALLELHLESGWLGRFVDPEIMVGRDLHASRQYFERGVRGRRLLNISAITLGEPAPGDHIPLLGKHVAWRTKEARLFLFDDPLPKGPSLVVAPHPDDAEIAAFGLYSSREAWVATVSAGEVGTTDFGGTFERDVEGARLRGTTRTAESIVAPTIGGVPWSRAINLGYFDGAIARMYFEQETPVRSAAANTDDVRLFRDLNVSDQVPDSSGACTWANLVSDLCALLDRSQATVVAAPHPAYERHSDHRYVGLAVMEAIERAALTDGLLLLYVVHPPGHGTGAPIHPVGSRDGVVSMPPLGPDAPVLFESIYSHPLTPLQRTKKLLALDVFRDIRPEQRPPPRSIGEAFLRALRDFYRYLVVYDGTFLRKAVRPNELFFVIPFARCAHFRARMSSKRSAQRP